MNKNKDDALLPALLRYEPVKTDPECRFANKNRFFQGVPTVEKTKSGLYFTAFYGGMTGEESGNFVALFVGNNPREGFGEPYLVIEAPTPKCRTFGLLRPEICGSSMRRATLILTDGSVYGRRSVMTRTRKSRCFPRQDESRTV